MFFYDLLLERSNLSTPRIIKNGNTRWGVRRSCLIFLLPTYRLVHKTNTPCDKVGETHLCIIDFLHRRRFCALQNLSYRSIQNFYSINCLGILVN